jgi:hypothetical protein
VPLAQVPREPQQALAERVPAERVQGQRGRARSL